MTDLRTAAQQALDSINELFAAEQSEGGERGGHIRTPATREHLVRVAQARRALHESCDTLRAALAQQDEPDHETRAELAEQQVVQLAEERDHYRNLWQKAQQAEPQGCATEEDCTKQPWCRIRGECQRKQAEPLNLRDPAVQKRLATQWGYVPAAQAEPVEPVAWVASKDGRVIYDDVSTDDGLLRVSGDFEGDEQRVRYAKQIVDKVNAAPPRRTMVPLTEEEILAAVGWERAAMYMKLATNFPVDEAKQETLTNARAIEKAVWEKNHG